MQVGRCADMIDREMIVLDLAPLWESLPQGRSAYVDTQSVGSVRVLPRLVGYLACQCMRRTGRLRCTGCGLGAVWVDPPSVMELSG
jgi:hypothetical protein